MPRVTRNSRIVIPVGRIRPSSPVGWAYWGAAAPPVAGGAYGYGCGPGPSWALGSWWPYGGCGVTGVVMALPLVLCRDAAGRHRVPGQPTPVGAAPSADVRHWRRGRRRAIPS